MTTSPLTEAVGWQDDAACADTEPGRFFSSDEHTQREALNLCRGCPVRESCLEHAQRHGERYGTWGGLREHERAQLARKRRRAA